MTPGEFDRTKQGQLLRQALIDCARSAVRVERVPGAPKIRTIEIAELLDRFIPEGATFDCAEDVLRNAGFVLEPRPTREAPGRFVGSEYEFDVNAFLGYSKPRFEGGVRCVIALRPAQPCDYGVVGRVFAICEF
jgi:hypothetical protein